MVRELGGTVCDEKTSEDVTESIRRKVETFENSIDVEACENILIRTTTEEWTITRSQ